MNDGSKNHHKQRLQQQRQRQTIAATLTPTPTTTTTTIISQCTHSSGSTVTDHESGEMVCTICGSVVGIDEELAVYSGPVIGGEKYSDSAQTTMRYNSGPPSSLTMHDGTSPSTMIDIRGMPATGKAAEMMRRVRLWDKKVKHHGNRGMISALSLLENLKTKLSLPPHAHEKAAYVYRKAVKKGLLRGRSSVHLVAAATYIATREAAMPISMSDIALAMLGEEKDMGKKAVRVFLKYVSRMYRILATELDIKIPKTDPSKLISQFTAKLGLDEVVTRAAVNNTRMMSSISDIAVGKNPLVLAATTIYITAKIHGKPVTQEAVADAVGTTSMSIRNACKKIHEEKLHEKFI